MSAGEVERLVSELSGGTGGDEEEEWLYGGTELPVPSLFPGSLKPPLPACKRLASRALHAAAWGLSYGSYSGLSLAERVVLASPPLGLGALPTPPTCTHPAAPGSNLGRWHGAWPSASPSSSPRLLGRLAFAHITLVFISILSSVHVFLLAPWL